MGDKVYLIVETVNHKDHGVFDIIPYWFDTYEEAKEYVDLNKDKQLRIEVEDRETWEKEQYGDDEE